MDDQEQRRREAYRNAASNLLAFGYEELPGDPITAALAILAARGHEATDPVILTMPSDMADMVDWAGDPSVIGVPTES